MHVVNFLLTPIYTSYACMPLSADRIHGNSCEALSVVPGLLKGIQFVLSTGSLTTSGLGSWSEG